jgi:hypothetical protein
MPDPARKITRFPGVMGAACTAWQKAMAIANKGAKTIAGPAGRKPGEVENKGWEYLFMVSGEVDSICGGR